jgi:uncharacterized protein
MAAEQGDAAAQFRLGLMYFLGQGVPLDHAEAWNWFRLAAEQGDVNAQAQLGTRYALGLGVTMDLVQAHMWFDLAAAGGEAKSSYLRSRLAEHMSPAEIAEAQLLARNWEPTHRTDE